MLAHGARWVGGATELDCLDAIEGTEVEGGGGEHDPASGATRRSHATRWERTRRRSSGDDGRPPPLFSAFAPAFSSSVPASASDLRRPPRISPALRAPGVPAPTWLGWTLGAAYAQISTRSGVAGGRPSSAGSRRHGTSRADTHGSSFAGGLSDEASGSQHASASGPFAGGRGVPRGGSALVLHCARLLAPACYFTTLLGFLLSAISLLLDQPVVAMVDGALHALPRMLLLLP